MDPKTMEAVYYIAMGLIPLLLSFSFFFLRRFYITVERLTSSVDKLGLVVSIIEERVSQMKENYNNVTTSNRELHKTVDNHETRITVLEAKVN